MHLKQKITFLINKIIRVPTWLTILVIALLVFVIFLIMFFQDRSVQFYYSEKNTCIQQMTFLPSLNRPTSSNFDFAIEDKDIVKLGNIQIISLKTCFGVKNAPSAGNTRVSVAPFGGWFARKTFILNVPQLPIVHSEALDQPIPVTRPLIITLSGSDLVFDYQLEVDEGTVPCYVKDLSINCDITSLNLLQDKEYGVKISRIFNGQKVATILSRNIKTLKATTVVGSSVGQGQIVYDKPKTFTFDFDKSIIKGDIILEKVVGTGRTVISITTTIDDKKFIVGLENDMERDSSYEFSIVQLEASDGSTLDSPYTIKFTTSDGPSVSNVDINAVGAPLTHTIVLTFDQGLSDAQDITKFVGVSGVLARISRSGNQVFISYNNAPLCADLGIKIGAGIQSNYGVTQNDPWSFSTRTICHTVSTIGYSREGRPILAYTFGNGARTILYTGAIHGNELSSKYLMDAWIGELEANARSIPSDKRIVVVPAINPDGVAAVRRNNSNNVDLNRNFPVSDWQTDIFSPANQPVYGGGGSTPFSEPESQAIAAFTIQLRPRLTMSFHSSASYAIGNQAGDSAALADTYAQLSGYKDMTGVSNAFSYPITGTYDDWMREEYGLTSVLVELSSSNNSEFSRNRAALWAMARS